MTGRVKFGDSCIAKEIMLIDINLCSVINIVGEVIR